MDGLLNATCRRDPAATAFHSIDDLFPAGGTIKPFTEMQFAFVEAGLRRIARKHGLGKNRADFLVRMATGTARKADDESTWRLVRDEKRMRADFITDVVALLDQIAR